MKKLSMILVATATAGLASAAWASTAPIPVSEPGSLGLLAAGVAGVVAVLRLRRRK